MNQNTSPKTVASGGAKDHADAAAYRRFCTQCRANLSAADRYCNRCGSATGATAERARPGATTHAPRSPARPVFTPALKTPEGLAVAAAIDARRTRLTRVAQISATVVASLVLGAYLLTAGFTIELGRIFGLWAGGTAFAAVIAWTALDMRSWTEDDYYSVPGSRDEQGEHRCIVCGHRGIYRHGEYKSNAEYADCSKCKTNLWVGTK